MPPPPQGMQMQMDLRPTPVVLRLLIALVVIWLTFVILINNAGVRAAGVIFADYLLMDPRRALLEGHVWEMATYAWIHDLRDPFHVLMNCVGLFFFGPVLERRWGGKAFLKFWVLCGLIAGVFTALVGVLFPGLFGNPVLGASGAVFGILTAFVMVQPHSTVYLFFALPVPTKYILPIALGLDLLFFVSARGVAIHAHVGGIVAAWLLITGRWRPSRMKDWLHLQWLKLKQRRRGGGSASGKKRKKSGLRVIDGGRGGRGGRGDKDKDRYLH